MTELNIFRKEISVRDFGEYKIGRITYMDHEWKFMAKSGCPLSHMELKRISLVIARLNTDDSLGETSEIKP